MAEETSTWWRSSLQMMASLHFSDEFDSHDEASLKDARVEINRCINQKVQRLFKSLDPQKWSFPNRCEEKAGSGDGVDHGMIGQLGPSSKKDSPD